MATKGGADNSSVEVGPAISVTASLDVFAIVAPAVVSDAAATVVTAVDVVSTGGDGDGNGGRGLRKRAGGSWSVPPANMSDTTSTANCRLAA